MTTYYQFTPSTLTNFQFSPILDNGVTYNAVITWNMYGQRYYINLYQLNGQLVFCLPLIASPDNYNINIGLGYFNTLIVFRDSSQNFEIG